MPVAALVFLLSCSSSRNHRSFAGLGAVTTIKVRTNLDEPIKEITDVRKVAAIVAFVDESRDGWGAPWSGVPVPNVVANFYDGETFKGHFGVGADFFEIQRSGDFLSKTATGSERRKFLDLLGVSPNAFE